MAFVGHPTARDSYTSMETFGEDAALCNRNWLHRHLLSFRDQAGSSHEICSPLPQDLNHTFFKLHVQFGRSGKSIEGQTRSCLCLLQGS